VQLKTEDEDAGAGCCAGLLLSLDSALRTVRTVVLDCEL
jgi:hypothetical protein